MDGDQFAAFVRSRRERLGPRDVGLQMLQRLDSIAALVIDATFEVLAWNHLAVALIADFAALTPKERNLARQVFLKGPEGPRFGTARTERYARDIVADLRAASARYAGDPELAELVADLRRGSDEFAHLWAEHEVAAQRTVCTDFDHPRVGPLTLCCEMLTIPERDQRLILYTAEAGTPSYKALQLLKLGSALDLATV